MPISVFEQILCSHCGMALDIDEAATCSDDSHICIGCADTSFYICDHCDLYTQDLQETDDGSSLCSRCQRRLGYYECDTCRTLINRSDLCSGCAEAREESVLDLVYHYGYKPRPVFHGHGDLFFGVELELNTPFDRTYECAELCTEYLGELGYLKQDESIDTGFEVVTHPMSYDWALRNFPWRLLRDLDSRGCDGDDVGLHIHVSRNGFTDSRHIYRWMQFIYRNADVVQTLARRTGSTYARFGPDVRETVKNACKGDQSGPRYAAINTMNDDTFELRMFAGTVDPHELRTALAFADASINYTRDLTLSMILHHHGWEWEPFSRWVSARPEYSALAEECEALPCAC
jgi:hypothetical protein